MPDEKIIGKDIPSKITDETSFPDEENEAEKNNNYLSDSNLANIPEKEKIYLRSTLATFSYGTIDPFLTTIAIDMGITGSQMGWLRAITNLLGNFVQPIFGFLSDKVQRRTIFVSLSNILYSSLWIILLFINKAFMIIVIAGIIAMVVSLGAPSWTALLGEVIPIKIRGRIISRIDWYSQFAYIISTIFSGLLLNYVVGKISIGSQVISLNIMLTILFGIIAGFTSAFIILTFKEKKAKERAQMLTRLIECEEEKKKKEQIPEVIEKPIEVQKAIIADRDPLRIVAYKTDNIFISSAKKIINLNRFKKKKRISIQKETHSKLRIMLQNKHYLKFTLVFGIQSFFMAFLWPLFPIRQRSDLGGNYFEIAIITVVSSLATILTIRYAGQISDLIGRKAQMFINRFTLIFVPLNYMLSTQIWHIIIGQAIICIALGLTSSVIQIYLIDVTPLENRSLYVGVFNMFYGIILFFGCLTGGYFLDFLMGKITIFNITLNFNQFTAVSIAFGIGLVGRFLTSLPFLTLREVKEFPLKPSQLPKQILKSRKLIAISTTISFFIGFTLILLGIMGYLP